MAQRVLLICLSFLGSLAGLNCGAQVIVDGSDETESDSPSPAPHDPCSAFDGAERIAECCDQPACHTVSQPGRARCMSAELLCYSNGHDEVFEKVCPSGYACAIESSADAQEVDGCESDGEFDLDFARRYCDWMER